MKTAGACAERLFDDVAAPLVLGGSVAPKKFLSGKIALAMGDRDPVDAARFFDFQNRRLAVARELLPLDHMGPLTSPEWALLACMHDLVLTLHPKFRGGLRDRLRRRVAETIQSTLAALPAPETIRECISRHTLFSRLFGLSRDDVKVAWWTGSHTFEGEEPSARLLAWPSIRRVQISTKSRSLADLLAERAVLDEKRDVHPPFSEALEAVLRASPFTYLLHAGRFHGFRWHPELLSWISAVPSRRLLLRALRRDVDAKTRIATYVRALDRRAPSPEVAGFIAEWAVEARVFGKTQPFADLLTEPECATDYAPILAAYERALASAKSSAASGRDP